MTHIVVTKSSLEVVDEEQFVFTQADNVNESEVFTLQRKEQSRQGAKEWVAIEEPSSTKTSVKKFVEIDRLTEKLSCIP